MDTVQRERKVDLNTFNREDAERIFNEVMNKVESIGKAAQDEITSLLKIYGLNAEFVINLREDKPQQLAKPKKGRPKKVK